MVRLAEVLKSGKIGSGALSVYGGLRVGSRRKFCRVDESPLLLRLRIPESGERCMCGLVLG